MVHEWEHTVSAGSVEILHTIHRQRNNKLNHASINDDQCV